VWSFGVIESPATKADDPALCARCHIEAQHDSVFGLPQ
jgi:hypothetical protein